MWKHIRLRDIIFILKWSFCFFYVGITSRSLLFIEFFSGARANSETTEPTISQLLLSKGPSLQISMTQGASRDSRIGETETQEVPSEIQEGILRPVTDPHKEAGPGNMSPKCNELGTDDSLCSRVLQEQVSPIGVLHGSDAHGQITDPMDLAEKNHYEYSELRNQDLTQLDCIRARVKPYECVHCRKAFRSTSDLVQHQQIHTGEKLFECKECGKAFKDKFYLTYHQRIHTGEKPYECRECGKAFAYRSAFVKHKKIHTRGKTFQCK